MYTLYYSPGTAAMAPLILFEEIGADYRLDLVDLAAGAHMRPPYSEINPECKVPALRCPDGGIVCETAAILVHVAVREGAGWLMPGPGEATHGRFWQWLFRLTNTIQTAFAHYYHADQYCEGEAARADLAACAEARLARGFARLDEALGDGPWFLGAAYSLVDPFLYTLSSWGEPMARPPAQLPNVAAFRARMEERPAVRRALAIEAEHARGA